MLLLLPNSNKLQVKWQGPYVEWERVGEVDYEIEIHHKGVKLFHVNLLKALRSWGENAQYGAEPN